MSWKKLRCVDLMSGRMTEIHVNTDCIESITKTNARVGDGFAECLDEIEKLQRNNARLKRYLKKVQGLDGVTGGEATK